MFRHPTRRLEPSVNASSMADIAFLLLIFFLVTTEIVEDRGVLVRLPHYESTPPAPVDISNRNVLRGLVNGGDELLVRGEPTPIDSLRGRVITFVANPHGDPSFTSLPSRAVVSLQNDRGTSYATCLAVYAELLAAYHKLWDRYALEHYGVACSEDLPLEVRRAIESASPLVISEAEPTSFGREAD